MATAKKEDGRRNNGAKKGENRGAGRKSKTDEEKSTALITRAIKELTGEKTDDKAKVEFIKRWVENHPQIAMKYMMEFIMGKPKEKKDIEIKTDSKVVPIITFVDEDEEEDNE